MEYVYSIEEEIENRRENIGIAKSLNKAEKYLRGIYKNLHCISSCSGYLQFYCGDTETYFHITRWHFVTPQREEDHSPPSPCGVME